MMSNNPQAHSRRRRYFFVWLEVQLLMALAPALSWLRLMSPWFWCMNRALALTVLMLETEQELARRKK